MAQPLSDSESLSKESPTSDSGAERTSRRQDRDEVSTPASNAFSISLLDTDALR